MAKKNKKYYSQIHGIEELIRHKNLLSKKVRIRERLLNKHINDLSDDFSADYIYRQSLDTFKLKNPLWNFVPELVKGKMPKKGFIVPLLSGLGVAVTSLFLFNKKGKTDILLKYEDGTNLFVGECKWWKGVGEFH